MRKMIRNQRKTKQWQFLSRKERGLSKYDAPLSVQFTFGYEAFKKNKKNPYDEMTMQYREWLRGWNSAYVNNLKKVKYYETRRRGKKIYGKQK